MVIILSISDHMYMANNKSDSYQYKYREISCDPEILAIITDSIYSEPPEEYEEWEPSPEQMEEYQRRLAALPPRQREALLAWLVSPRMADVSAAIDCHPGDASRLIGRAMARMGLPKWQKKWLTTKKGWVKREE
jgi:DNA-directed RNA polymerase specialized sigma24 family protein